MHKIFAKPVFLGKRVIFLPQCHSTNDELSRLQKEVKLPEGTIIYADHQTNGRGQRGNQWEAASGKNVLMSMLLKPKALPVKDQFYLNLIAGLAIKSLLEEKITGKEIKLKWPNDVLIDGRKISGILIESTIKGTSMDACVVGIGLNLNQEVFNVATATSLALEIGQPSDRYQFIEELVVSIEGWYLKLMNHKTRDVLQSYYDCLYWKDEMHTFKSTNGTFKGMITGITDNGRLIIESDGKALIFGVQEVQFID